jgi:hypothetical protein
LSARKNREIEVMLKNTPMKACKIVAACKVSPKSLDRIQKKVK